VLNVSAGLSYQGNLTQINRTVRTNQSFSRALNDPSSPLGAQAAMAVINETNYGLVQTISVLRFNSLSIAYRVPPSLSRYLHTSAMTVALQGTNLGLRSDYSGADPNVNAYGTGNSTQDTGILPTPRMWQLRVNVGY
jgi:hypothetical protein